MQLHLILGPTSVGKTARSVMLAKQTKAPIIVLDRIQIYQELATGSGRPLIDELDGTTRIYLEERQLAEGELTTVEALSLTLQIIERLSLRHNLLLLEGGSISLCTAVFESGILDNYQTTIEYLNVQNEVDYYHRLWSRIQYGLISHSGRPSVLEELARIWREPRKLAFVRTILGYHVLADWCERLEVTPDELWDSLQEYSFYIDLNSQLFSDCLQYSRAQRQAFDRLVIEYDTKLSSKVLAKVF